VEEGEMTPAEHVEELIRLYMETPTRPLNKEVGDEPIWEEYLCMLEAYMAGELGYE
jgi:hypothetical protein